MRGLRSERAELDQHAREVVDAELLRNQPVPECQDEGTGPLDPLARRRHAEHLSDVRRLHVPYDNRPRRILVADPDVFDFDLLYCESLEEIVVRLFDLAAVGQGVEDGTDHDTVVRVAADERIDVLALPRLAKTFEERTDVFVRH